MSYGIRGAACLTLLILTGCTNAAEPGAYAAPLCASDGSCADSARCVAGICHETCAADADCPAPALCRDGVCWAAASGACATDADCTTGEACVAGSCATPPSTIACADDADCPASATCDGGSCVSRPAPAAEICGNGIDDDRDGLVDEDCPMTACTSDSDCAAGETCVAGMTGGTCVATPTPACTSDSDCAAGETCVAGMTGGTCVATPTPACTSDGDCAAGEACLRGVCVAGGMGDADGDGYAAPGDCDDADASVHPGAAERCDGVDNDCDGTIDEGCGGGMTTACGSDTDCEAGQICLRGYCASA